MARQASQAGLFKDEVLDRLATIGNVAQFVSFEPSTLKQRYSRVVGHHPNARFQSARTAIEVLLQSSPEHRVNVRSFEPEKPRGGEFVYGLRGIDDALSVVRRLAKEGRFSIVNETIDVNDGGVSGVSFSGVVEFAPEDTPRCVEKPGTARLPLETGVSLLERVYGFKPDIAFDYSWRTEFSVHPLRRGVLRTHTVLWEQEQLEPIESPKSIDWPNRFSVFIGDKVFGLLVAHEIGLLVPHTVVIAREIAPFSFGERTGTGETWIRTCPREQVPGRFTTQRGWTDPYRLLASEDGPGSVIASVLSQEGVDAAYSGAAVVDSVGSLVVEGVRGSGESFMQGSMGPENLPEAVWKSVESTFSHAVSVLGPVRMEWVFDGMRLWVVQLHVGKTLTEGFTIYPGVPRTWYRFDVVAGLEVLRGLLNRLDPIHDGVVLVGRVGVTSHMADLLRREKISSKVEPEALQ